MEVATCERIIKSIDTVMKKDPHLDEFDFVYSTGEINRSPIIHEDHKLGLETWCVKYVYSYSYSAILDSRTKKLYKDSCSILRWTQICLLITPEVSSFWNIRKKMIQDGQLKSDTDLLLSRLVLTRKPKCIEAFQHRRWLYRYMLQCSNERIQYIDDENAMEIHHNAVPNGRSPVQLKQFLMSELDLCCWTASRKPNNYHSWNHRLWVFENLLGVSDGCEIYKMEYDFSHEWASFHVSEHSGLHYLMKIVSMGVEAYDRGEIQLESIYDGSKNASTLYQVELEFNYNLNKMYPGHEALFCQRRTILLKLRDCFGGSGWRALSPPSSPPLPLSPFVGSGQRVSSPPSSSPSYKRSCIEVLNAEWAAITDKEVNLEFKEMNEHHKNLVVQHSNWVKNVLAL